MLAGSAAHRQGPTGGAARRERGTVRWQLAGGPVLAAGGHRSAGRSGLAVRYRFPEHVRLQLPPAALVQPLLAATVLGERLAVAREDGAGSGTGHNVLGRLGMVTILGGLVGVGLSIALLFGGPAHRALEEARRRGGIVGEAIAAAEELALPHPMDPWLELSSPFQKRPPSPVYFAFFGGSGLALLYLCRSAEKRGWVRSWTRYLARFGSASLFVFVAQYYVFFAVLRSVKLPTSIWWPVPLIGLSGILIYSGIVWERRGWNRWLTVGYPWLERQAKAHSNVWAPRSVARWLTSRHGLPLSISRRRTRQ